jgi:hypothetical protein
MLAVSFESSIACYELELHIHVVVVALGGVGLIGGDV